MRYPSRSVAQDGSKQGFCICAGIAFVCLEDLVSGFLLAVAQGDEGRDGIFMAESFGGTLGLKGA